jgi:hypothetical protein
VIKILKTIYLLHFLFVNAPIGEILRDNKTMLLVHTLRPFFFQMQLFGILFVAMLEFRMVAML